MSVPGNVTRVHTPRPVVAPLPEEGDFEGRMQYYSRKLGFKVPVTLRFALAITCFTGVISASRKKTALRLPIHIVIGTPVLSTAICSKELYGYALNYYEANYSNKDKKN
jgi:hypothetical protein